MQIAHVVSIASTEDDKLKKLLMTGFAAAALLAGVAMAAPANAQDHVWGPHFAISIHGNNVYTANGADEADARSQAMFNCQRVWGANACTNGTSVPNGRNDRWNVSAIACGGEGRPFSAGSEYGYDAAYQNAIQKAENVGYSENSCYSLGDW